MPVFSLFPTAVHEVHVQVTLERLLELLSSAVPSAEEQSEFTNIARLLETLRRPRTVLGFARSWLDSARDLALRGERNAALFQVRQVAKRLGLSVGASASGAAS